MNLFGLRSLRWLGIFLLTSALLFVVALIVIISNVDRIANAYRVEILTAAGKALGGKIEGRKLHVKLWNEGVENYSLPGGVVQVQVDNAHYKSDPAESLNCDIEGALQSVKIQIELFSLLAKGSIFIPEVILTNPQFAVKQFDQCGQGKNVPNRQSSFELSRLQIVEGGIKLISERSKDIHVRLDSINLREIKLFPGKVEAAEVNLSVGIEGFNVDGTLEKLMCLKGDQKGRNCGFDYELKVLQSSAKGRRIFSGRGHCVWGITGTCDGEQRIRLEDAWGLGKVGSVYFEKIRLLRLERGTIINGSGEINSIDLKQGQDRYKAESVRGTFVFEDFKKRGWSLSLKKLRVSNFDFNDSITNISHVDADFDALNIQSRSEKIDANADLKAIRLNLRSGNFGVRSVESVTASLKIEIPYRGGYEVKGPVTVKGAELRFAGKVLNATGGTVEILVSGPLKRFESKKLQTFIGTLTPRGGVLVTLENKVTKVRSDVAIGNGSLNSRVNIERSPAGFVRVDISGSELPLSIVEHITGSSAGDGAFDIDAGITFNKSDASKTLEGSGKINLRQGIVVDGRLVEELKRIFKVINKSASKKIQQGGQQASAKFRADKGVIKIEDGVLKRRHYTLTYKGKIEHFRTVTGTAELVLLRETFAQLGLGIAPLRDIFGSLGTVRIPLRISGTADNPEIKADWKKFVKRNSGVPLARKILGGFTGLLGDVTNLIASPFSAFRVNRDEKSSN